MLKAGDTITLLFRNDFHYNERMKVISAEYRDHKGVFENEDDRINAHATIVLKPIFS